MKQKHQTILKTYSKNVHFIAYNYIQQTIRFLILSSPLCQPITQVSPFSKNTVMTIHAQCELGT